MNPDGSFLGIGSNIYDQLGNDSRRDHFVPVSPLGVCLNTSVESQIPQPLADETSTCSDPEIYSLQGIRITSTSIDDLPCGLYIIVRVCNKGLNVQKLVKNE